ncbi:methyl-accepting chemotaxis protein [Desulfovibrio ferrophilus]|uniref:Methyl-accepting chemotaxis sensory transducer with Pas/Pac sensor n=1 Tax=Desulfovibrio ferrophilus TaxID=241368 RepID=A0A2Z6AUL4_9BACT|nr:methyl-accepting chemotaxis protein [Desulfovibrio ferrophilus]BBD06921.1 methyl-accepting chemotaxis sensory transducer with Pas/Pac sensor [Desulfovibrio ferrophilus]
MINIMTITLATALAGCILALVWQSTRRNAAFKAIENDARRISDGDLNARFTTEGKTSPATDSLNTMTDELVHRLSFANGVLDGIDTPYVVVDTNEILVRTNPSLITILEQEGQPDQHYGQDVSMFFYGEKRRTVLAESLEHHTVTHKEVEFVGRKGGKRNILINASPLFDMNNKLMGALCIYQDLTDLRRKEAEVMAQAERIADAVRQSEGVTGEALKAATDLDRLVAEATSSADRQTARSVDTATAMEQMNITVMEVARNASDAAEQASLTRDKAHDGAAVVLEATSAMDEVNANTETLRRHLEELGTYAEGIGSVMNVITDIADQTNLLALNAAIEAARAGDAGRGFAVVADEVRKLAEKTMGATKEVGDAIAAIQDVSRISIEDMGHAAKAVVRTRELSAASGAALEEIVELAVNTSDQVRAIATASEEQSATSEHINQSVEDVRETSEQLVGDMNVAAEELRQLRQTIDTLSQIITSVQV